VVGVKVAAKADPGTKRREFTLDEARAVLTAARETKDQEVRWLVWLLALTGARVGELAQLDVKDVRHDPEGGWFISIEPGNGKRVKTDRPRSVPLHREVLDEGFLEYVKGIPQDGRGEEPRRLFPGTNRDEATRHVGRFVRGVGRTYVSLKDRRLAPAHSWRHLMATRLRAASVRQEIAEAILGHAGKSTVHDRYGSGWPLKVLRKEGVDLLPPLLPPDML
jgi:integrase